jgi:hypothetical protein
MRGYGREAVRRDQRASDDLARVSIYRIHAVMHHFKGEADARRSCAPSRKLWTALHELDGYLMGQGNWLVNCAERHRAGLRVGTTITEGDGQFPSEPSDEQVSADAMVSTRRRSTASSPLHCL